MASDPYDVIVIGGGPAGLTSAIYTARANLKTLIMTGQLLGGQIAFTFQVDNYPGFPETITGPELSGKMRKQAERFSAEFLEEEATAVDFSSTPLKVNAGDTEYEARAVIIATGSLNKKLGLESEERLMGRGVFVCATCDALLYEGKKVVVVGGGDSAVQEALDLAKFAREVVVVHRRNELTACRCLKERASENERIRFLWSTVVQDILGESRVEGVRLKNRETGEEWTMECDGVLLAIGWVPNTSLFRGQLDMDENGYIVSPSGVDTSVRGVYVAGDLNDTKYRQLVTACGSGCMAALEAERYIDMLTSGL
jgi:thioredoxin reductase (NADPH)